MRSSKLERKLFSYFSTINVDFSELAELSRKWSGGVPSEQCWTKHYMIVLLLYENKICLCFLHNIQLTNLFCINITHFFQRFVGMISCVYVI